MRLSISTLPLGICLPTYPLYPPPLIREGGIGYVREAKPLFNSPYLLLQRRGGSILLKELCPFKPPLINGLPYFTLN